MKQHTHRTPANSQSVLQSEMRLNRRIVVVPNAGGASSSWPHAAVLRQSTMMFTRSTSNVFEEAQKEAEYK